MEGFVKTYLMISHWPNPYCIYATISQHAYNNILVSFYQKMYSWETLVYLVEEKVL